MSERWDQRALLAPIAGENPCGQGLEISEVLSFDAYRVFGQQQPLDAPLEPAVEGRESGGRGRKPKPASSPEWLEIRDRALEALAKGKDLRALVFLGAALLRTDGLSAFCRSVMVASQWLIDYWDSVYPLATEDAIERQGALGCFGDQFGVVDAIRRTPLVGSRRHGQVTLRDLELGAAPEQVDAAFDELPLDALQALRQDVTDAVAALASIDARMREADPELLPAFETLSATLVKIDRALRAQLARRPGTAESQEGPQPESRAGGAPAAGVGVIRSREDAIRALEAVAAFFQQTEPSSPIPLLLDRAKRLVSRSFLEVLADIAPGALGEARVASGLKQE